MIRSIFRPRLGSILALAAILALATVAGLSVPDQPAAEAQDGIGCGDTIGPWEFGKLDSDLSCDSSTNPALTVVGPAVLDLNGHTVSCAVGTGDVHAAPVEPVGQIGILVKGIGAIVKNGQVTGCVDGVVVGEAVDPVSVDGSPGGFHVVANLEVTDSAVNLTGIVVNSDRNLIAYNNVHDNDSTGILVNGNFNVLKKNTVQSNSGDGIGVAGHRNLVASNTTNNNADDGIDVDGQNNVIKFNNSSGNTDWDMEDGNTDCDSNVWGFNTFGDANQTCIG